MKQTTIRVKPCVLRSMRNEAKRLGFSLNQYFVALHLAQTKIIRPMENDRDKAEKPA